jgi:hypothetical protein
VSSVLATGSQTPVVVDSDGEDVSTLAVTGGSPYLLMAKLNFVSVSGATATCNLMPGDGGPRDHFVVRLGGGFDTTNTLMLPHTYAAGTFTASIHCSTSSPGDQFTVTAARLVAIQSQALTVLP